MHDHDEIDDHEFYAEACDISDVQVSIKPTKLRNQIVMVVTSETDFNLMKFYLSLKQYVTQIETEIGVMEAPPEVM